MATIEDIRTQINQIDAQLVALLDQRAGLAKDIGKAKLEEGMQTFFDASRQKQVVARAQAAGSGVFPAEAIRAVFTEIMSASLLLEKPPTVGYLGPEATYSHVASLSEFGQSVLHQPYNTVPDIFTAVDRGWINYGVLPVENSTHGVLHSTLDLFLDFDLQIISEIYQPIHHHLVSRNPLDRIKTIYSKAEPFMQCQIWLKQNLPGVQLIETSSSAKGVEMARDRDFAAAIGSEIAARKYNVPVIAADIEDMKDNATRFVVVGKQQSAPTGSDRTTLMASIDDKPGALYDLLRPLHDRGINLTKIESRPTRRKAWDLVFFMDMLGHKDEAPLTEALEELRKNAKSLRIMGSYPRDTRAPETMLGPL